MINGAAGARSTIFLPHFSHSRQTYPVAARIFGMRIRLYAVAVTMVPTAQVAIEEEKKGSDLCKDIQAIQKGRTHAKKFEEKVIEALRYIFDKDLTAWSPQKSSDTKLSFYDLVARVASEHDFWNTIVTQFRSRYIIFEFKNYGAKIKQGQIYTTEKYLFRTALRSTAIIISRTGADKNALAAARGALRESGKLIINLSVEDLCMMLHRKDSGDDPNALLLDRVDEMLMRLERLVGLMRRPIRDAFGTNSCSSSSRLDPISTFSKATPVRLPPGRFRLVTNPDEIGSLAVTKTIGMVVVAAFATGVAGVFAAITATCRPTRSVANDGKRS